MNAPVSRRDYTHLIKAAIAEDDPNSSNLSSVLSGLRQVLADSFTLAALAKNAHWNATGPSFFSLHAAFDGLYETADSAVDDLAERLRQLNEFVTVDLATFQSQAAFPLPVPPKTSGEWVDAILAGIEKTIGDLKVLERASNSLQFLEVQDLALGQAQALQKWHWQFSSVLK